jgi:hypothetical protein
MVPVIESVGARSLVDVGCDVGWYVFSAAFKGLTAIGIEPEPRACRLFLYTKSKLDLRNVGLLVADLSPVTKNVVPNADAILFMSVWHHLVRYHGLEAATELLEAVWERTDKVLFFETGEQEMPPRFHLPEFKPDAQAWIERYLTEHLAGSRVTHLGRHSAFTPDGRRCFRNLFAVIRESI